MSGNVQNGCVRVLDQPFPFRAMVAICSDLDETASAEVYFNTSKFLNSTSVSPFGKGVGLEVGNSMYFHMAKGEFSYWNASEEEQSHCRDLIRSGHIDSIHSFGDTAVSRSQVAEILDHLDQHNCKIAVWIDHAVAPTNFGKDIMQGNGDVVGADAYHADLTVGYGVQYAWMGRVTSMHGQDAKMSLAGILDRRNLLPSMKTYLKEAAKVGMGILGSSKYRMHKENDLFRRTVLRDGQAIVEFMRCNPNSNGVSSGETAAGLVEALDPYFLDDLASRHARSIIYTHLGKEIDSRTGFSSECRNALEGLADRNDSGEILVTTTRRLLDYAVMRDAVEWTVDESDDRLSIKIDRSEEGCCLDGLSFEVPAGKSVEVVYGGEAVKTEIKECLDSKNIIVQIPWMCLKYE